MGQPDCSAGSGSRTAMRCSYRGPGDDFFCLRYGVWYRSFDCAARLRFRTFQGCLDCDQGRFNLRRHGRALTLFSPQLVVDD